MSPENYTLTWDDYKANIQSLFQGLRNDQDHLDVTLACEDAKIHAHKVVLSASSPVFRDLLRREILLHHHHPIIFLRGVRIADLRLVLDFVYRGEVTVSQEDLGSFLAVGADLRIKGLTEKTGGGGADSNLSSPHRSSGQPTVESPRKSSNPSIAAESEDDFDIQGVMSQVKREPAVTSAQLQDQTRSESSQNVQNFAQYQQIAQDPTQYQQHIPVPGSTKYKLQQKKMRKQVIQSPMMDDSSVGLFTHPINENLSEDENDGEKDLKEAQLKMGNKEQDMENNSHDNPEFGKIRIQDVQVSLKMLHEAKSGLILCESSKHTRSSRGLQYEESMGPYQDPEEGYENNNRQRYNKNMKRKKCVLCGKTITSGNMSRHQKKNCTALKNLGD